MIGSDPGWEDEYTDPNDPESFQFLLSISPYHNAKYHAPLMLMTGKSEYSCAEMDSL